MYVYAQIKKVTWYAYAHAHFSGGLNQDKASIFISYQSLVAYWWFLASQENAHAYE
tara:strand:+ start:433 stop:600 length:168 start_codon:yes stop_codon:yes gene_type:complete